MNRVNDAGGRGGRGGHIQPVICEVFFQTSHERDGTELIFTPTTPLPPFIDLTRHLHRLENTHSARDCTRFQPASPRVVLRG